MEYTGYESAFVTTGPPDETVKADKPKERKFKSSASVERKTETPSQTVTSKPSKEEVKVSKQRFGKVQDGNILNSYRSVTYNFTLAALKKSAVKDPEAWESSARELTILKSGGKGTTGLGTNVEGTTSVIVDPETNTARTERSFTTGRDLVEGFNKESPGRFDLFIENIEIETLMTFDQKANNTLPTKITFDVIEPFSVNGFVEALHVASVAAGYVNYTQGSFILKMEFIGYPDNQDLPVPEVVPNSIRYFVFGFTGMEVDITEKGTRYKCTGVPFNEKAFGQPNNLVKPIKMSGTTVGEILDNFMDELNKQVKANTDATNIGANDYDEYEVKFPVWDQAEGWVGGERGGRRNTIANEKLTELYKDNILYNMSDPGRSASNAYKASTDNRQNTAQPQTVKYEPNKTVVQFSEKTMINDAITAVVRDSEYTRKILKEAKIDEETGMIKYFMVRMEVVNKDTNRINELTKKPAQKYTFVVTEYETHYTRLGSAFSSTRVDEKKIKKLALREYNYIYTGLNVDIINFKLNFNTLFFEALPAAMGSKNTPAAKVGAGNNNDPEIKVKSCITVEEMTRNEIGDAPVKVNPDGTSVTRPNQPNAGQILNSPYDVLAKNMHEAIIDSKASMLLGEIEIAGDPFYLVTGGIGNYNPKPKERGQSLTGEAMFLFGDVLININFRNPIDIRPAEEGGTMFFDSKRAPFSGVYRVTKAVSTFREGVFRQKLDIMRIPGQLIDEQVEECSPRSNGILQPKPAPINQIVPDTTRGAPSPQQRPSDSVVQQIASENVSVSTSALPNTGQLGGNITPQVDSRNYGLVNRAGQLVSNSNPIGKPITDISQSRRLDSAGLFPSGVLSQPALVAAAVAIVSKDRTAKQVASVIAGGIIKDTIVKAGKIFNKGSGIGEGASLSVSAGDNISAENLISQTADGLKKFGSGIVDSINNIPQNLTNAVSDVGNKVNSLLGSVKDPNAVGANLGIDIGKISGLGGNLSSNLLNKIKDLPNTKPENTDLQKAIDQGVQLDFLPKSAIKNLPPTMPFSTAPLPVSDADEKYIKEVAAKGPNALIDLYGVNNLKKISSNIAPPDVLQEAAALIPATSFNPLAGQKEFNSLDNSSLSDKFKFAKDKISNLLPNSKIPGLDLPGATGGSLNSLNALKGKLSNFNPNVADAQIQQTVGSTFGSAQVTSGPLNQLFSNLNDPNSPTYAGNDPAIRRRLGLPPLTGNNTDLI